VEPVADVRAFSLAPRKFFTRCGGLFLFLPELVRLDPGPLAQAARLPGSKRIPPAQALRACLALKLWSIARKSHVIALAADEGLALFSGLNATPKKSYLSEYSCRITPRQTDRLLAAWHDQLAGSNLLEGSSFNLDFHSVPYYGQDPVVEKHYISARSRSQPGMLVFLAQDEHSQTFCYSNADLRKGEEAEEIFRFIRFWEKAHGQRPRHLVFDSKLTTQANLARLDRMKIDFITLRRRSPALLREVYGLPRSAWRTVQLEVPSRQYQTPRVYEQAVTVCGRRFRQLFVLDLGHDKPTILLTNQSASATKLITRYARRMLIENNLSDAVRFFQRWASRWTSTWRCWSSPLGSIDSWRVRCAVMPRRKPAKSSGTGWICRRRSRSPSRRSASSSTAAHICRLSWPQACATNPSPFPGGRSGHCD
jgi:hypothetical protein